MKINNIELNPLKTYIIDFDVFKEPHIYVVDSDLEITITDRSPGWRKNICMERLPEIEDERQEEKDNG